MSDDIPVISAGNKSFLKKRQKIVKGQGPIKHWNQRSKDVRNSRQMELLFCPQASRPNRDFETEFRNLLPLLWIWEQRYYRHLECQFRPDFGALIPMLYCPIRDFWPQVFDNAVLATGCLLFLFSLFLEKNFISTKKVDITAAAQISEIQSVPTKFVKIRAVYPRN